MTKYIRIFLLLLVIGLVSCEGPMGPPGEDGQDGWANIHIEYVTITSSAWLLSDGESYFYADVSIPELDDFVYNYGVVMGYYMQDFETSNEVQVPLPFDMYQIDGDILWTETLSFDFVPGSVRFYFEPSDFYTDFIPAGCSFKLALMW